MHKVITLLLLSLPAWAACPSTWSNGYQWQVTATVPNAQVSGSSNLTNYPVGIWTVQTWFKTTGNGGKVEEPDGADIIVESTTDGVDLDYELAAYNGSTGEVELHVKIPVLDWDDDTLFCIYLGKSGATTLSDPSATWSAYSAVYHFNEDPSDSAPQLFDSVAEIKNATCYNMESGDLVDVKLGKGIQSADSAEYCEMDSTTFGNSEVDGTISIYFNPTPAWGQWREILSFAVEGSTNGLVIRTYDANQTIAFTIMGYDGSVLAPLTQTVDYHHITQTWWDSFMEGFFDGGTRAGLDVTSMTAGWSNSNNPTFFTRPGNPAGRWQPGIHTEVRMRWDVSTEEWNDTESNNLGDPTSFVTFGSPVGAEGGDGQVFKLPGVIGE